MAENFELTDTLKASIGQTSEPWTYEVTTTSVRAFARGVGRITSYNVCYTKLLREMKLLDYKVRVLPARNNFV